MSLLGALWRTLVPSDSDRVRGEGHLIVCVHRDGWRYFLSEPFYWILDREPWLSEATDKGHSERFDIAVVTEAHEERFLQKMEPFEKTEEELRRLLLCNCDPGSTWSDIISFLPALFIDFQVKRLVSCWPDSPEFENYVPAGWTGEAKEFLDDIPLAHRYWVVDGRDYWAEVRHLRLEDERP